MKPCTHTHAIAPRKTGLAATVDATDFGMVRTLFVYQQHPVTARNTPILPHRWSGGIVNGGAWDQVDADQAATDMAEWLRRTMPVASGPIVLNVESIPLDTPEADAFWSVVLPAMRAALPRATFGFYDRPDLGHLVDFYAPCVYPMKRIQAECWADGEHEQTPAFYRQATFANLARFDRKKPWLACCTLTLDADNAIAWASALELREQWRMAQDVGANIIWWGSVGDSTDLRRAKRVLTWLAMQRAASPVV